jgi:hypothetical protein
MSGNGCEGGEEGGQAQIGIDFRWREEGRNEKGGGGGGGGMIAREKKGGKGRVCHCVIAVANSQ